MKEEQKYNGSKTRNYFTAYLLASIRGKRLRYLEKQQKILFAEENLEDKEYTDADISPEERLELEQKEQLLMEEAQGIYPEKLKSMPNMLSGGQQQRVAIARALITKPAIILADEPTGNLDSKTSRDVLELIQSTSRKFEQSVVMITHNEHIADLAQRIVRIEDGKFLKTGVGENEKIRE